MAYQSPSGALYNPAAYGKVPVIPATSTTKTGQVAGWTTALPGYEGLAGQASGLAGKYMAGQLPADVLSNITTAAAERGIATGSPGSPNANAAYLRALGLSTLDLEQRGMQDYINLLNASPRTTTTDTTQTIDNSVLKAIYEAAPDPYLAAMANLQARLSGEGAGKKAGAGGGGGGFTITGGPAGGKDKAFGPISPATWSAEQSALLDRLNQERLNRYAPASATINLGGGYVPPGGGYTAPPASTYYDPFADASRYDPYGERAGMTDWGIGAGLTPAEIAAMQEATTYGDYYDTGGAPTGEAYPGEDADLAAYEAWIMGEG